MVAVYACNNQTSGDATITCEIEKFTSREQRFECYSSGSIILPLFNTVDGATVNAYCNSSVAGTIMYSELIVYGMKIG